MTVTLLLPHCQVLDNGFFRVYKTNFYKATDAVFSVWSNVNLQLNLQTLSAEPTLRAKYPDLYSDKEKALSAWDLNIQ